MKARILALLAMVLGVVSCQTEPEGLDVNVGGEQEVAICVSLPETTRANVDSALGAFANVDLGNADDSKTIRYILKIYQKVGENYVASNDRQVEYSDGTNVVFPVRLVPNRDYRFVVWADYVESKNDTDFHYNTANLANITIKGEWEPMDETRDAFTGYFDTVEKGKQYTSTSSINITLTRPFAKLRVITTDMKELGYLGIVPHNAAVTYTTQFHESFNAFNGEYGAETVSKAHTSFTIKDYADFVGTDKKDTHKVLFTDYFFADDSDVVKFVMNVNEENTALIKSNTFNTDIAVQRNYLTTIQGNILTDGNNVTVTVEDAFVNGGEWNPETDEYDVEIWDGETLSAPEYNAETTTYTVSTASEFVWLTHYLNGTLPETRGNEAYAKKNFILTLDRDLDFGNNPFIPVNNISGLTFDGNNHTIKNMYVAMGKNYASMFEIAQKVTIKNLKFDTVYAYATNTGRAATLVGYLTGGVVENVHVKNVEVRGYQKLAGLIAYITQDGGDNVTVKNCSVENVTIGASDIGEVYQAGGLVGYISSSSNATLTIEECEVKGIIAINDTPVLEDPASFNYYSGGFIGSIGSNKDASKVITINLNECKVGDVTAEPALSVSPRSYTLFADCVTEGSNLNGRVANKIFVDGKKLNITTSQDAFVAALKQGGNIVLSAGEYTFPAGNVFAGEVTLVGADLNNVVVTLPQSTYISGTTLTLENLTFKVPVGLTYTESKFAFIHHAAEFNMNNCVIDGGRLRLNVAEANIDNCQFKVTASSGFDGYGLFYYGNNDSTVNISNSTFTALQKAVVLYNEAAVTMNLNVNKCTFTASESTDKAAISIHSECGINGNVNISNSSATGFANYNDGLWRDVNNSTGENNNKFSVTVDGVQVAYAGYEVVAAGVFMKDGEYYVNSVAGLQWIEAQADNFFAGKTIKLMNDIDCKGAEIKPIRFWEPERPTTFDGQEHTIVNVTMNMPNTDNVALFNGTAKIKNLNVDKATIVGRGYVGVIGGALYGSLDNCHVTNSTVTGNYWQVGGLVGQYDSGDMDACSVLSTTITGPSAVGALAGIWNEAGNRTFKNCKVEDCAIKQNFSFGDYYDTLYGVLSGSANATNTTFTVDKCVVNNNTIKGFASETLVGEVGTGSNLVVK